MTIKQLSIFLENKKGRINEVSQLLGSENINMKAFSMAETAEFGILRLIVDKVDEAIRVLRAANIAVVVTDVIHLECDDTPSSLSKILDYLAEEDVFIEYMYAFSANDKANIIIRPTRVERCLELLKNYKDDILKKQV